MTVISMSIKPRLPLQGYRRKADKTVNEFLQFAQEQSKALEELLCYVEHGRWREAERAMGKIQPLAYELEGWRDLLRILRWQIERKSETKSAETIRLLLAELRAEY